MEDNAELHLRFLSIINTKFSSRSFNYPKIALRSCAFNFIS